MQYKNFCKQFLVKCDEEANKFIDLTSIIHRSAYHKC